MIAQWRRTEFSLGGGAVAQRAWSREILWGLIKSPVQNLKQFADIVYRF